MPRTINNKLTIIINKYLLSYLRYLLWVLLNNTYNLNIIYFINMIKEKDHKQFTKRICMIYVTDILQETADSHIHVHVKTMNTTASG